VQIRAIRGKKQSKIVNKKNVPLHLTLLFVLFFYKNLRFSYKGVKKQGRCLKIFQ